MHFDLTRGMQVLERTPNVLRGLLSGLDEAWTSGREGPGTWSAFDVLGHLIHGERDDWIPRARIILEQGPGRTFDPFDREAMFEESRGKDLGQLLDELAMLRAENLGVLAAWRLTPAQLSLPGTHPLFGPVTLGQLLATWVVHDLDHITQVARVLAKQYTSEVGPWHQFLSLLGDRVRPQN